MIDKTGYNESTTINEERQECERRIFTYFEENPRYFTESIGKIKSEYFSTYGPVFKLFQLYYSKYQGIITPQMVETYRKTYQIDDDTYVKYRTLEDCKEETKLHVNFNEAEFNALINELNLYYRQEKMIGIAQVILDNNPMKSSDEKMTKLEEYVQTQLTDISADNSEIRKAGLLSDSAEEQAKLYLKIKNNPELQKFIPSGFDCIDKTAGGFRPSEMICVTGRKGAGKSVCLLNMAHAAWKNKYNVLLFTLEVPKEDYERRFAACAANINSNNLKRGQLEEWEEKRFRDYLKGLKQKKSPDGNDTGELFIVDVPSKCSPAFIESTLVKEQQRLGIKFDVIVVDYLGIMIPNVELKERRLNMGQIALDLKRIARKYNCVMITAAQMNRRGQDDLKGKDGQSDSNQIADSDQIADHVDMGFAIYSMNDEQGFLDSWKTRDMPPFKMLFMKHFAQMRIDPCKTDNLAWN